jgi:hypothetical protein
MNIKCRLGFHSLALMPYTMEVAEVPTQGYWEGTRVMTTYVCVGCPRCKKLFKRGVVKRRRSYLGEPSSPLPEEWTWGN